MDSCSFVVALALVETGFPGLHSVSFDFLPGSCAGICISDFCWPNAQDHRPVASDLVRTVRHLPRVGCILLLAQLLKHWPRASAIEPSDLGMCGTKRYRADERILNPAFLRIDHANLFWINESGVRRQLCSAGCKGRLRLCSAEKNGKTDAVVQPDATSFAACDHLTRRPRHVPTARSRANSSVFIHVHPRFQNAILRRADERDLNPRSVEPSCANAPHHGVRELKLMSKSAGHRHSRACDCYVEWPRATSCPRRNH